MKASIPIYQYTITLTDGTERKAAAMSHREYEEWLLFDDTRATVYQVRREKVNEISRSTDAVGTQEVDEISDNKQTGH